MRLSVLALVVQLGLCGISARFDHEKPPAHAAGQHEKIKDEISSDDQSSADLMFDFFTDYISNKYYEGDWSSMNLNILSETEGSAFSNFYVVPHDRSASIGIQI